MFHFFRRNKQQVVTDPKTTLKQKFEKELDVRKYCLPTDFQLPANTRSSTIEKLIRSKKIAPVYPSEEPYCNDDKICMICFQTVRQGMNSLECCENKRYICSSCLIFHPRFNVQTCKLHCDICQKETSIVIPKIDVQTEVDKIFKKPKEFHEENLLQIIKNGNQPTPTTISPEGVHQEVIDKFRELGIRMREDINADVYNSLNIKEINDPDVAMAIMLSLC